MKLLSSGHRGYVYIQKEDGIIYAIKKAKTLEKKGAIKKEIVILNYLKDKVDFVPVVVSSGEDFFKYKFIEGTTLDKIKNPSKNIYKQLIKYAYNLDKINVEHGELSKPTKNIIVSDDEKVYIIDFERGNLANTKGKNLKGMSNFLMNKQFISLEQCQRLQKIKNLDEIYNFLITIF